MKGVLQPVETAITGTVPGATVSGAAMAMGWGSEVLSLAPTVVNMFTGLCGAILALIMAYTNWRKYQREQREYEKREQWTDEEREAHREKGGR